MGSLATTLTNAVPGAALPGAMVPGMVITATPPAGATVLFSVPFARQTWRVVTARNGS